MNIRNILSFLSSRFYGESQPPSEALRSSSARGGFCSSIRSMATCCKRDGGVGFLGGLKEKCAQINRWITRDLRPYLKGKSSEGMRCMVVIEIIQEYEQEVLSRLAFCTNLSLKVRLSYGGETIQRSLSSDSGGRVQLEALFDACKLDMINHVKMDWSRRRRPNTAIVLRLEACGKEASSSRQALGQDYLLIDRSAQLPTDSSSPLRSPFGTSACGIVHRLSEEEVLAKRVAFFWNEISEAC